MPWPWSSLVEVVLVVFGEALCFLLQNFYANGIIHIIENGKILKNNRGTGSH